jgi:hypothetical protein
MKQFNTKEEVFASQNFDPSAVTITGVPEQHLNAVHAIIKLFVAHDAVNPDFQPDFSKPNQWKYQNWFRPGSPSGVGFSYYDCDYWSANSAVGSRLVSESGEAGEHIAALFLDEFKEFMIYQRKTE